MCSPAAPKCSQDFWRVRGGQMAYWVSEVDATRNGPCRLRTWGSDSLGRQRFMIHFGTILIANGVWISLFPFCSMDLRNTLAPLDRTLFTASKEDKPARFETIEGWYLEGAKARTWLDCCMRCLDFRMGAMQQR